LAFILRPATQTGFAKTTIVAGWPQADYLFFVGCYFTWKG